MDNNCIINKYHLDNNCIINKYHLNQPYMWIVMARIWILAMCAVTSNVKSWSYNLGSRSWHWDNNCMKYQSYPTCSWNLWQGQWFWLYVHCDLDLGNMTLGQRHYTTWSWTTMAWSIIPIPRNLTHGNLHWQQSQNLAKYQSPSFCPALSPGSCDVSELWPTFWGTQSISLVTV